LHNRFLNPPIPEGSAPGITKSKAGCEISIVFSITACRACRSDRLELLLSTNLDQRYRRDRQADRGVCPQVNKILYALSLAWNLPISISLPQLQSTRRWQHRTSTTFDSDKFSTNYCSSTLLNNILILFLMCIKCFHYP
jgi:hypothetical protein